MPLTIDPTKLKEQPIPVSAVPPTESESERLSLIRYQLLMAREQASAPTPINALSINMLQDSVEALAALAAEHLQAPLPNRPDFLALIEAVAKQIGPQSALPGLRSAMASMNLARVNFKHHGNIPTDTTVRKHLDRAEAYVDTLCVEAFGCSIDDVSLLLFVRCTPAREQLQRAQELWPGDVEAATGCLRTAFEELVHDYEKRKSWHPGKSLFATKPSFAPNVFDLRDAGKTVERLAEWIENLDSYVRHLAIGIDMREYAHFDAHMPHATRLRDRYHLRHEPGIVVTDEIFGRCYKFVVDTALSFAASDFDFDHWAIRQSLREAEDNTT